MGRGLWNRVDAMDATKPCGRIRVRCRQSVLYVASLFRLLELSIERFRIIQDIVLPNVLL